MAYAALPLMIILYLLNTNVRLCSTWHEKKGFDDDRSVCTLSSGENVSLSVLSLEAPRDYLAITSSNENLNCSDVGEEIKEEELNTKEGCNGKSNQTNIFSFDWSSKRCEITEEKNNHCFTFLAFQVLQSVVFAQEGEFGTSIWKDLRSNPTFFTSISVANNFLP